MSRALLPLVAFALLIPAAPASSQIRSDFQFETDEAFDASSIAPYDGDHQAIYRYIDENLERHVESIRRWLRSWVSA